MDRLSALSRGAQIMLGAGVLLFIDLFLPWQSVDLPDPFGSVSQNGWHGFWGVVLGLLLIIMLAWIVVRIAAVDIPLPVSSAMTAGLLGTLILFFAVIKNLVDDYSTIWSYIGVVLAALIAYGAWHQIQEAGGIDHVKSQTSSLRPPSSGESAAAAGGTASGTAAATPPPAPAPTETAPPPVPEPPAATPPADAAPGDSPGEPSSTT